MWIDCALAPDETAWDLHIDAFRTIVRLAALVPDSTTSSYERPQQQKQPRFTFEMGLLPILSFVSVKCRCLRTRAEALRLMRAQSAARENAWDAEVAFQIGRRVVLLENGVDVEEMMVPEGLEERGGVDVDTNMKPWEGCDVARIPDLEMEPVLEVYNDDSGGAGWRGVSLFCRGEGGKVLLGGEVNLLNLPSQLQRPNSSLLPNLPEPAP